MAQTKSVQEEIFNQIDKGNDLNFQAYLIIYPLTVNPNEMNELYRWITIKFKEAINAKISGLICESITQNFDHNSDLDDVKDDLQISPTMSAKKHS